MEKLSDRPTLYKSISSDPNLYDIDINPINIYSVLQKFDHGGEVQPQMEEFRCSEVREILILYYIPILENMPQICFKIF